MKYFTIIKVGYTAGVYGNTGEQFQVVWTTPEKLDSYMFEGQFGVEHRVADVFKEYGYKENYSNDGYGKMTRKEAKAFTPEHRAIKEIKELLGGK